MGKELFIGVDVGTGSVRAGLFNSSGHLLTVSVKEIQINNPEPGYYEQSSDNIWSAVCHTVRDVSKSLSDKGDVKGLAFCATCSLVAIGENGTPISVNKSGEPFNIVMWMDHRAEAEAQIINKGSYEVLRKMGGKIFLEMETPKLLWLKKYLPESYSATQSYFDLADFLRWRATNSLQRSVCCVTCKWTWQSLPAGEGTSHWSQEYFKGIGIGDALPKIGLGNSLPGDKERLSSEAAKELGLTPSTLVGFSQIDAHCGVLGLIGCHDPNDPEVTPPELRFSLICGTSNCHMSLSREKRDPVPGIWGPFFGVTLPDLYLNEAGQSAAGKLVDHIVTSHPAYPELLTSCGNHGKVLEKLGEINKGQCDSQGVTLSQLTRDLHVWPDFHGNRSPLSDPSLKGMICGLTLSQSREDLARLYLATIQALAYGSKHIMDTLVAKGYAFREVIICGGLVKSKDFVQIHADVLDRPVVIPHCTEPVLLGAAISAAAACDPKRRVEEVMRDMAGGCTKIMPNKNDKLFHEKKYKVFLKMVEHQREYRQIMDN